MDTKSRRMGGLGVLLFSLAIGACGGSDDGGGNGSSSGSPAPTSAPVEGVDLSGTYAFQGVECYDESTDALTLAVTVSNYVDTIEIDGNSFTNTIRGGSCNAIAKGKITFNTNGTFNALDTLISVPEGGSCTFTSTFTVTSGSASAIPPKELTFTDGETVPALSGAYVQNPDLDVLGLEDSTFQFLDEGVCFQIYKTTAQN